MYVDSAPCAECGSEVRLRPHPGSDGASDAPVGPPGGVVGDADQTVDVRECTDPDCPTRAEGGPTP